jgi:hypothetical protein
MAASGSAGKSQLRGDMTDAFKPRYRRRPEVLGCLLAAAGFVGAIESLSGQEADNVTIDARRCMQIESPAERLACFEAQVGAAPAATSDGPVPPPAAAPAPRTVDVGAPPAQAVPAAPPEATSFGNITSLQLREPNRYLITLDTGQVWEQRVAARFPLRVGQRVRIEPTRWGSSERLYVEGLSGFIQVSRVR